MQDEFAPGKVVAGKFRIERVLGQGGMGLVVEATHLQLDQRVALKFLMPGALRQTESLARFAREAKAAAAIRGEHVARVIDVGTLDSGAPYIVMEFLDGHDLARSMAERGILPVPEAITFILQACEALAEAHARGIVHRDLKPSNLFVTSYADGTPCLKILDFGISKLTGGSSPDLNMTDTATVMGTPHYMSPEQMRSTRSVDARSDIWALGVILYELVSGEVPFKAETMPQLCSLVLESAPAPLSQLNPKLPAGLEQVILRCLEKDPSGRYQNIAELATALVRFAPPEGQRSVERIARLVGSAAAPPSRSGTFNVESVAKPETGAWKSKRGLIIAAVVLGVSAVCAGVWFSQSDLGGADEGASSPLSPPESVSPAPETTPAKSTAAPPDVAPSPPSSADEAASTSGAAAEPHVAPADSATDTRAPAQRKPAARRDKPRRKKRGKPDAPSTNAAESSPAASPNPLDGRL